ncbi:splicing factor 1 [Myzus persicae]|uniref:splicing factor 1 n=1 Tax=Myzus persicae TaxID=13164 RepID=UPI000B937821|nr:splicing factor 1 [Myzus persicae]XP_022176283.1 splicing factor 1 [Myzus persicae]
MSSNMGVNNYMNMFVKPQNGDSSLNKRESSGSDANDRKRKKKSRWGGSDLEKTFIPGMPTVLPHNLTKEQEEAYILQLQIEEIGRKLRTGELGIPSNPEERSPSPEPIYSSDGKRMNTREYRTRKKLEEERHRLIQRMAIINPTFKPPADYKPPVIRVSDKVMIPQDEHPDINFVGLLIGPRGNTLKSMEKETGAKIIIRGKGSVKEGKVARKDGQPLPGEDEPLHAYVTGNNPEYVQKAVNKIKEIIKQGVEVPEGQNDLRRMQLRELALLNGTLRENDGPRCSNCGAADHKSWMCQDKPNVTNSILCTQCGGAGHIAKDCRMKNTGGASFPINQDKNKIDEEYMSLMAELGEGPPPPKHDDNTMRPSVGNSNGGLFNKPQPLKPLMSIPPPHSIPNSLPPPPWSNQPMNGAPMPPPGINVPPPWQMPPPSSQQYSNIPPPPPVSNQNFQQQMPWAMPPPPPPPNQPTSMPPPWQQGPPPAPPAPTTVSGMWPPPTQPWPSQQQQQAKAPPSMNPSTMMMPPPDLQTLLAVPPPPPPPPPSN